MRSAVIISSFLWLFLFAPSAEARIYCPLPEDGIWINPDAAAKELTRLEIETKCIDNRVQARIRAFTKCSPRDCKWGWTPAEVREGGGLRVMLIGFLGSKIIDVRAFSDRLDAFVTDVKHDPSLPGAVKSYTLRKR